MRLTTRTTALLLVLGTIFVYRPAFEAGFIWDDDDHLTENQAVVAPDGLRQIWSSVAVSRYYPLTLTSFWAQQKLWGLTPAPYHVVTVAIHALNAALLFLILRRLEVAGAWVAAALWAVHPVNVESVAWITELKNTQSLFFFLLAIRCWLRQEQRLSFLAGTAALLSKPSTVVLPAVLLLMVWWQHGRWRARDFLRVTPVAVLAAGMSLLAIVEQRGHVARTGAAEWTLTLAQRVVLAGEAVWFYAARLFWPVPTMFVYPRWDLDADRWQAWVLPAALVAGGICLWRWRRNAWARPAVFGAGYFAIGLLPVLGFFDVYYFRYSYVADHFQYLASIGFLTLIVAGIARLLRHPAARAVVAGLMLVVLGFMSWQRAGLFHNEEQLWRDTLDKNPAAWIAHNNLGLILVDQGRVEEAVTHYRTALGLRPHSAETHLNLASALEKLERRAEAEPHYREAIRLQPSDAVSHYNLARLLADQGRPDEALAHYRQAIEHQPDDAPAHFNLANLLAEQGATAQAVPHFESALRIDPGHAKAHTNLANLLAAQGRVQPALAHYREAVRLQPDLFEAHNNLAVLLAGLGKFDEAIPHFRKAVQLRPDLAEVQAALAEAEAKTR